MNKLSRIRNDNRQWSTRQGNQYSLRSCIPGIIFEW